MSWHAAQGFRAWIVQRVSAIYLFLFFAALLLCAAIWGLPLTYQEWRAALGQTWINVAAMLFFVALVAHAWVGVRDVVIDYVKPLTLRLLSLALFGLGLLGMLLWSLRILWRVSA